MLTFDMQWIFKEEMKAAAKDNSRRQSKTEASLNKSSHSPLTNSRHLTVASFDVGGSTSNRDAGRPIGKRPSRRMSGPGGTMSPPAGTNRMRIYKSSTPGKWVTREMASLEFLLGIPMEAERDIVSRGWMQQHGIVDISQNTEEPPEQKVDQHLEPPSSRIETPSPIQGTRRTGKWWEKWVSVPSQNEKEKLESESGEGRIEEEELEQPPDLSQNNKDHTKGENQSKLIPTLKIIPGRRLHGGEANKVQVPLADHSTPISRQKSVVRMAVTREWEINVAHGIDRASNSRSQGGSSGLTNRTRPPMLDGRLFLSAGESYPMQVFSLIRYEPKKEEAARRRKKLEERGGGGTSFFIMPVRDWRGISYRSLLPQKTYNNADLDDDNNLMPFYQFTIALNDTSKSDGGTEKSTVPASQDSETELISERETELEDNEDTYVVGLLDDPEMVQGKHRNVMIGDMSSGPIVSSTIQFVKPELLKADLNKQFRDRFDGWEPPRSQRKYIGARVMDGVYTLMDPCITDEGVTGVSDAKNPQSSSTSPRKLQGSSNSSLNAANEGMETLRMPPSLTLSKIRSVKQQALFAAVKAKLEMSTVALAIVYFERLCLDCRVDKSNRRLSFAACLLLASKMNEAHVELVMAKAEEADSKGTASSRIQSLVRPTRKSDRVFASLIEFFTQDWGLPLKHIFAAEWGVFAALQFRLHAKPSQVAFHFKRLLKSMEWNPRTYLGLEMYSFWQDALIEEDYRRIEREERLKLREEEEERKKLLRLQRELVSSTRKEHPNSDRTSRRFEEQNQFDISDTKERKEGSISETNTSPGKQHHHATRSGIGSLFNRFSGGRRVLSSDKLNMEDSTPLSDSGARRLHMSPSLPAFPIVEGINETNSPTVPFGMEDGSNKLKESDLAEMDEGAIMV